MLKLYGTLGAGSAAPQAALAHAQADYEMKYLDFDAEEHKSPAFLAINPRGQVPTLVLDDGAIVTESAAIALHIADAHPAAGLIAAPGSSERAQTYRWVVFVATNLYEAALRYMYPHYYTTSDDHAGIVASADASLGNAWGIVNDALHDAPALVGGKPGIADIYLAMLFTWHHDTAGLQRKNLNLRPALERTLALQGVAAVFEENGLSLDNP